MVQNFNLESLFLDSLPKKKKKKNYFDNWD